MFTTKKNPVSPFLWYEDQHLGLWEYSIGNLYILLAREWLKGSPLIYK